MKTQKGVSEFEKRTHQHQKL